MTAIGMRAKGGQTFTMEERKYSRSQIGITVSLSNPAGSPHRSLLGDESVIECG